MTHFIRLYRLDELEAKLKLKNQELSAEDIAIVDSKLELLSSEISAIQNSSQNITKSIKSSKFLLSQTCPLSKQILLEFDKNLKESETLHTPEATRSNNVIACSNVSSVEEYIAQDEVFEAYIPRRIEENLNSDRNYDEQVRINIYRNC